VQLLKSPFTVLAGLCVLAVVIILVTVSPLASTVVLEWARGDAELRSRLIFNSIQDHVVIALSSSPRSDIVPLLERITEDERIEALGYCSATGAMVFQTKAMPQGINCVELASPEHESSTRSVGDDGRMLATATPLNLDDSRGYLVIVHDLSSVQDRARKAQLYAALAIAGVAVGFAAIAAAVSASLFRTFMQSVRSAVGDVRRGGESGAPAPNYLPYGREIKSIMDDLRIDQKEVEGIVVQWSPKTIQRLLELELPGAQVMVVSNREPYIHNREGDQITLQTPASGLVAALEPVMRACGGTWIAHGSGSADRETVDARDHIRVPPAEPSYTLRRVWLSEEEADGYYYGLANEGLWPLCHIAFIRPTFRESDWQQYVKVNERFADAVAQESQQTDPVVLVQDYHFALLPRMIRRRMPHATILMFWHIPWPNAETFGICPWREQLVDGLLGSSVLGFHTRFHCNNFFEAVDRFMESRIDREHASVTLGGHETLVRPYPISVEWMPPELEIQKPVAQCRAAIRQRYGLAPATKIIVGVERFDYTKGIIDRLKAFDELLARKPQWRGAAVFIQVAAPTRSKLPSYSAAREQTEELARRINQQHGSETYQPLILEVRHHEHNEVFELFRGADVCIVSSLHDGMNLVAKEFVAARDDEQGVLILSSFAGASRELASALIVNPYDTRAVADTIDRALTMPAGEQRERMRLMRELVRERNVYRWAGEMFRDLARLRKRELILSSRNGRS
jgi:trehalose 6-phosphate synthase